MEDKQPQDSPAEDECAAKPQPVDVKRELCRQARRKEKRKARKANETKQKVWRKKGIGPSGVNHPAHNREEQYIAGLQKNPEQARMRFRAVCQLYLRSRQEDIWDTDDNEVAAAREKHLQVATAQLGNVDQFYARCDPTGWPAYFVEWCGDGIIGVLCTEWVHLYASKLKSNTI